MHDRVRLLRQIQEVHFGVIEWNLYLNTHPRDQRALEERNYLVQQLHQLMMEYEQRYDMLTPTSVSEYPWEWINEPWPWEVEYR